MLCSGDVPGVGSDQRLHHLDAKASTVTEEHGELGHGGQASNVMLADCGELESYAEIAYDLRE